MKTIPLLFALILLTGCSGNQKQDTDTVIAGEIATGNFTRASQIIDSLVMHQKMTGERKQAYLFTKDSLDRVALDFNRTKEEILAWIKDRHDFEPSEKQLTRWEESKTLEYRIIDGKKRYFRNAAANIFRIDPEAKELSRIPAETAESGAEAVLNTHLSQMKPSDTEGKYTLPKVTMHVRYTLTVKPDAVKEGELVRAWLPYPRQDIRRQTGVRFIRASQPHYTLSQDKTAHTSIYMERKAEKGKPVTFSAEYEFSSQGEWYDLSLFTVLPYKTGSEEYIRYTSERIPHIQFTDRIKSLTDSVTQYAGTPVEMLQAIYRYIAGTYPWASALEYSTIGNIPEYVLENRKGDCGQVALLLITMLRYKGIPARWQSGWMMHPGEVNLHDWAEAYFEGIGWVPADISFGRGNPLRHKAGRTFFMSGIDSYRLYVNSDYSGDFFPEKIFFRSETVDFQRGEAEAENGNLYFDKWNYNMQVTYVSEK